MSDATKKKPEGEEEKAFQSTHRVSDATMIDSNGQEASKFQSTHRVSDATIPFSLVSQISFSISIHAPRERCDL